MKKLTDAQLDQFIRWLCEGLVQRNGGYIGANVESDVMPYYDFFKVRIDN